MSNLYRNGVGLYRNGSGLTTACCCATQGCTATCGGCAASYAISVAEGDLVECSGGCAGPESRTKYYVKVPAQNLRISCSSGGNWGYPSLFQVDVYSEHYDEACETPDSAATFSESCYTDLALSCGPCWATSPNNCWTISYTLPTCSYCGPFFTAEIGQRRASPCPTGTYSDGTVVS